MCKRVLSVVLGANGSGKSSLARSVMGPDILENKSILGTYSVCENIIHAREGVERKPLVAIGKYSNECGGVDTVKLLQNAYRMGFEAVERFAGMNIFMESLLLSTLFSAPLKFYIGMKYDMGFDVEICLLYVSEKEALRRVFSRNGGVAIKPDCVCRKVERSVRVFEKLKNLAEFRCFAIDTVGKSKDQVFSKFVEMSNLYEKRA